MACSCSYLSLFFIIFAVTKSQETSGGGESTLAPTTAAPPPTTIPTLRTTTTAAPPSPLTSPPSRLTTSTTPRVTKKSCSFFYHVATFFSIIVWREESRSKSRLSHMVEICYFLLLLIVMRGRVQPHPLLNLLLLRLLINKFTAVGKTSRERSFPLWFLAYVQNFQMCVQCNSGFKQTET